MYGGGYSGLGGMSGYGGMSSYGGGMGGYGGMSTYGNSYGSNRTLGSTSQTQLNKTGQQGNVDPNNPDALKQNEQINHRKNFFEQWFKMMGGLRSILELGFAAIALANFWTRSTEIFKKLLETMQGMGKTLASFIESKLPTKVFTNLAHPSKRTKVLKSFILSFVRLFAFGLLCIGIKLRQDIIKQAKEKRQAMIQQLQKLKDSEVEMVEDEQPQNLKLEGQKMSQEANL